MQQYYLLFIRLFHFDFKKIIIVIYPSSVRKTHSWACSPLFILKKCRFLLEIKQCTVWMLKTKKQQTYFYTKLFSCNWNSFSLIFRDYEEFNKFKTASLLMRWLDKTAFQQLDFTWVDESQNIIYNTAHFEEFFHIDWVITVEIPQNLTYNEIIYGLVFLS